MSDVTDWWKWTTLFLASLTIAMITFTIAAATRPTTSEGRVREIISQSSPWALDRGRVLAQLDALISTQQTLIANGATVDDRLGTLTLRVQHLEDQLSAHVDDTTTTRRTTR